MKLLLALLAFVTVGGTALAETAGQPLTIELNANGAAATRLPQYEPNVPVAISVSRTAGTRFDAAMVVARGPAGEAANATLRPAADGTLHGTFTLQTTGLWNVQVVSRGGGGAARTLPVTLDVETPPPSSAGAIGFAVAATIFIVIGGSGFALLRRTVSRPVRIDRAA